MASLFKGAPSPNNGASSGQSEAAAIAVAAKKAAERFSVFVVDDTLTDIQKCKKYMLSQLPLQRLVYVGRISQCARSAGLHETLTQLLPVLKKVAADSEITVRQTLASELGLLAAYLADPRSPDPLQLQVQAEAEAEAKEHDVLGDLLEFATFASSVPPAGPPLPSPDIPDPITEHKRGSGSKHASSSSAASSSSSNPSAAESEEELAARAYKHIQDTLLPCLQDLVVDASPDVQKAAVSSMVQMAKLMRGDDIHVFLAAILRLAHDDRDEQKLAGVTLLNELSTVLSPVLCKNFVARDVCAFADDPTFRIRKAAAQCFSNLSKAVGPSFAVDRLLPPFIKLSDDMMWGVRRSCVDSMVSVAESIPLAQRQAVFVPMFTRFAKDSSRWVRTAAFSMLGPLIHVLGKDLVDSSFLKYYTNIPFMNHNVVDAEVTLHCAYNFPAVLLALGPSRWSELQPCFQALLRDSKFPVRRTVACALHDLARILQRDLTEQHLLAPLEAFLRDIDEVRSAVFKNLSYILQILSPAKRLDYLPVLYDIQKQSDNWRYRQHMARQMRRFLMLYPMDVTLTSLMPLLFALCRDKVAAVRDVAARSVGVLVYRVYTHFQAQNASQNPNPNPNANEEQEQPAKSEAVDTNADADGTMEAKSESEKESERETSDAKEKATEQDKDKDQDKEQDSTTASPSTETDSSSSATSSPAVMSSAYDQCRQLILSFYSSPTYLERQLFVRMCQSMLPLVPQALLERDYLPCLARLMDDRTPNVRLALAKFIDAAKAHGCFQATDTMRALLSQLSGLSLDSEALTATYFHSPSEAQQTRLASLRKLFPMDQDQDQNQGLDQDQTKQEDTTTENDDKKQQGGETEVKSSSSSSVSGEGEAAATSLVVIEDDSTDFFAGGRSRSVSQRASPSSSPSSSSSSSDTLEAASSTSVSEANKEETDSSSSSSTSTWADVVMAAAEDNTKDHAQSQAEEQAAKPNVDEQPQPMDESEDGVMTSSSSSSSAVAAAEDTVATTPNDMEGVSDSGVDGSSDGKDLQQQEQEEEEEGGDAEDARGVDLLCEVHRERSGSVGGVPVPVPVIDIAEEEHDLIKDIGCSETEKELWTALQREKQCSDKNQTHHHHEPLVMPVKVSQCESKSPASPYSSRLASPVLSASSLSSSALLASPSRLVASLRMAENEEEQPAADQADDEQDAKAEAQSNGITIINDTNSDIDNDNASIGVSNPSSSSSSITPSQSTDSSDEAAKDEIANVSDNVNDDKEEDEEQEEQDDNDKAEAEAEEETSDQ